MAGRLSLVLALAAAVPVSSVLTFGGHARSFLGNGMQPEVVAKTLSNVEEEWKAQAAVFAECNETGADTTSLVNCNDAPNSFGKSCSTVVSAIVQGSGGDKDVAHEYMADVCTQPSISGWHQDECNALSVAVNGAMSADKYENRMNFNTVKVCDGFWSRVLDREKARAAQEKADREAKAKKEAEEAAEKERIRQEEAKKEEEKRQVEEAERQKEEAKKKAEEAAEAAAQKKAEAEAVAEAAKQKAEEAQKAAEQHQKAQEAAKEKSAAVANATSSVPAKVNATTVAAVATPVAAVAAPATKAADAAPAAVDTKAPAAPAANASVHVQKNATVAAKNATVAAKKNATVPAAKDNTKTATKFFF